MAKYLLIESRDPYEYADAKEFAEWAAALANAGNQVSLFLVQNAVLPLRKNARGGTLQSLSGVKVYADDYSLQARGIGAGQLTPGVEVTGISRLVDLLMEDGVKAVWH